MIKDIEANFVIAIVISVLLTLFIYQTTPLIHLNNGRDSDGLKYAHMSGDPYAKDQLSVVDTPFNKRIIIPQLARLLPFEALLNFKLLGVGFNACSLLLIYLYGTFQASVW